MSRSLGGQKRQQTIISRYRKGEFAPLPTVLWVLALAIAGLQGCPEGESDDDATNTETPASPEPTEAGTLEPSPGTTPTSTPSSSPTPTPAPSFTPTPNPTPPPQPGPPAPIFITLAGHIEHAEAYTVCDLYSSYRTKLLEFADYMAGTGATFNLQMEYEFLVGVRDCETEEMMASTDGLNVLEYLGTVRGFELDPHQEGGTEEGADNYADIRYLLGELVSVPTETVGGLVWEDPYQFETLENGETGWIYEDFTWYPDILTLGVGALHHEGNFDFDDLTSGVWRPAGGDEAFFVHDPETRVIYVGPGLQHQNWGGGECAFEDIADYVGVLVDYMDAGRIPRNAIYTGTLAVPQSVIFDRSRHGEVGAILDKLEPYVASGRVVYATYREVVRAWLDRFDGEPNLFLFDDIDPADYTCE